MSFHESCFEQSDMDWKILTNLQTPHGDSMTRRIYKIGNSKQLKEWLQKMSDNDIELARTNLQDGEWKLGLSKHTWYLL